MAVIDNDGFVLDNEWRALILLQWRGGESDDDAAANTSAATAVIDDDGFVLDNEAEYNNYCSLSNVNQATDGCVCYVV